jgi:uncharacterized protein YqjF (DUF2071 family)
MRWLDLLFAHWPFAPEALGGLVPPGLELDTFEGQAWIGIVPFTMTDVSLRGLPAIPRLSTFPEINVRTYVRRAGSPGVLFLSLDGGSRPTTLGARQVFHLPYFDADSTSQRVGDAVTYRARRVDHRGSPASFEARYRPIGPVEGAAAGSLEAWLTDRSRLFSVDRSGRVWRTEIAHDPWPLQRAVADIDVNTMATAVGIRLPGVGPHLRFASRLDVHAWLPVSA